LGEHPDENNVSKRILKPNNRPYILCIIASSLMLIPYLLPTIIEQDGVVKKIIYCPAPPFYYTLARRATPIPLLVGIGYVTIRLF
jgi:hypothetical protein